MTDNTENREILIRSVNRNDIKAVAELEKLCFSVPMNESNLTSFLLGENGCGFVLYDTETYDKKGIPCAYGGMICVLDEAQILNIATHPDFRRKGYGKKITERLVSEANSRGIVSMTLEVRRSNEAARKLYESLGFYEVGILKNYYKYPTEDGLILKLDIK